MYKIKVFQGLYRVNEWLEKMGDNIIIFNHTHRIVKYIGVYTILYKEKEGIK